MEIALMLWLLAGLISWLIILWNDGSQLSVNEYKALLFAMTLGPIVLISLIALMIHAKVSR